MLLIGMYFCTLFILECFITHCPAWLYTLEHEMFTSNWLVFQHIWPPEVAKKVFSKFIKAYIDLSLWIEHPNSNAIIPSAEGKPWNTWKHIHTLYRTDNWCFQGHLTWGQASIMNADVPSLSDTFFQLPLQIMQRTGNTHQRLRSSNISLCLNTEWLNIQTLLRVLWSMLPINMPYFIPAWLPLCSYLTKTYQNFVLVPYKFLLFVWTLLRRRGISTRA